MGRPPSRRLGVAAVYVLDLMGGPLGEDDAAYVLRCDSLDEARAVVATDPLVSSGACAATVAPWQLIGVDPRLIDPDLVVPGGGT
ncbi:UNVERIFIED_ORG: hypothetical protein E4P37_02590 [Bacillus sp. AZ43]